ncbi:MAG: hypothetical protein C5B46_05750 [Proteobacteria bacterium]|nr:MAG: hypothetical protein C5B46_05750 [Pseudomonadota bacterium]
MGNAVLVWWSVLCTVSLLNIAAWVLSAKTIGSRAGDSDYALRRQLLVLSAVYVAGCAFRSFLPMMDVPRLCLHDTWFSRIFVGRSVATVAEVCFAVQWSLLLAEAAKTTGSRFATFASRALVPLVVAAEVSSWTAVLTTNHLLHAVENSLWTVGAALALIGFISLRPSLDVQGRRFASIAIICSALYLAFMLIVDVPMWLGRWQADLVASHADLPARVGLRTLLQRCIVTRDWAAWHQDIPWLSLYFTAAVWISIGLAYFPRFRLRGPQPS